jgi:hypothetical protein
MKFIPGCYNSLIVAHVPSGLSFTPLREMGGGETIVELVVPAERKRPLKEFNSDIFNKMTYYWLISSHTQLKETIINGKSLDLYGDACFGLPSVCRIYLLSSFTVPLIFCMESGIRDRIFSLN